MRTKTADGAPGLAWPGAILPLRRGRFSARVELRSVVVTALVVVGALGCAVWSLTLGSAGLGVGDLVDALRGTADANTTRTLLQWRMPRTVFALFGGAALGAGGAVFQSITRNPLGSPDIIGFSTGAYTGALLVMLTDSMIPDAEKKAPGKAGLATVLGFAAAMSLSLLQ